MVEAVYIIIIIIIIIIISFMFRPLYTYFSRISFPINDDPERTETCKK